MPKSLYLNFSELIASNTGNRNYRHWSPTTSHLVCQMEVSRRALRNQWVILAGYRVNRRQHFRSQLSRYLFKEDLASFQKSSDHPLNEQIRKHSSIFATASSVSITSRASSVRHQKGIFTKNSWAEVGFYASYLSTEQEVLIRTSQFSPLVGHWMPVRNSLVSLLKILC